MPGGFILFYPEITPMKALKTIVFVLLLTSSGNSFAQSDTAIASQRALLFADSLLNAFRYHDWNAYLEMSYPGVIKYYGGKKGFQEYILRARQISDSQIPEKTELVQILNDITEWQCVIRKKRETTIDGKKAVIISYLVGQSKDEGKNWRYVDVAFNSVANITYIMPDIFDTLAIPQRQIVFEKNRVAKSQ